MSAVKFITDFHSHLVPGVDDGAQQSADSAVALQRFRAEGATQVITTPHFMGSLTLDPARCEERLGMLDDGWEVLRAVVADDAGRMGSALRVERGAEVMLDVPDPDLSDDAPAPGGRPVRAGRVSDAAPPAGERRPRARRDARSGVDGRSSRTRSGTATSIRRSSSSRGFGMPERSSR